MSDAASAIETCMICFVKRKCRYLGKEGQGFAPYLPDACHQ